MKTIQLSKPDKFDDFKDKTLFLKIEIFKFKLKIKNYK